ISESNPVLTPFVRTDTGFSLKPHGSERCAAILFGCALNLLNDLFFRGHVVQDYSKKSVAGTVAFAVRVSCSPPRSPVRWSQATVGGRTDGMRCMRHGPEKLLAE